MSLRFLLLILAIIFCTQTHAENLTGSMEMALATGDYFSAYRISVAAEESSSEEFLKNNVEGYLKSLFVIGTKKQITSECARLSNLSVKATYLCALNAVEEKEIDLASKFLKKIDDKTKFHYPAQILRATVAIVESNFESAVNLLNPDEIEKYKELQLDQLFYLTRARALIGLKRFEEATKYSQSVDSKTPYYVEALEQTSWIFFKSRKFESAQILLDVIISTYESPQKIESDLKISPSHYYRSRYLKAYLALLEQRPEGAANEFSQLKGDYDKFLSAFKKEKIEEELKKIQTAPIVSSEIKTVAPLVGARLNFFEEWLGAEVGEFYNKQFKMQTALNNELLRMQRVLGDESKNYISDLDALKKKSFEKLEKEYVQTLEKLAQSMSTLSLKCELGRLDVFWLNRAQGARNLEEVIDSYKQTTKSIENYVDL